MRLGPGVRATRGTRIFRFDGRLLFAPPSNGTEFRSSNCFGAPSRLRKKSAFHCSRVRQHLGATNSGPICSRRKCIDQTASAGLEDHNPDYWSLGLACLRGFSRGRPRFNRKLPADARVRVFGGDPGLGDYRARDGAPISILKEQVFEKHGKALLVYGPGHLFRTQGNVDFLSAVGGGITRSLEPD